MPKSEASLFFVTLALSLSLFGSLLLTVSPTLAPSGSNLLSQAFTGFLWLLLDLSLSLSCSLWLSVTPTLALTCFSPTTIWHTLALSGSLLLSNFVYTVLDRLSGPLLGSQRRCHADALSPALLQTGACHSFDRYSMIVWNWNKVTASCTHCIS